MIESLKRVDQKWERDRDRARSRLAGAIASESSAASSLDLLNHKKRTYLEEMESMNTELYDGNEFDSENQSYIEKRRLGLNGLVATINDDIEVARKNLDRCQTERLRASLEVSKHTNKLNQLEKRVAQLRRLKRLQTQSVSEEESLESWQNARSTIASVRPRL